MRRHLALLFVCSLLAASVAHAQRRPQGGQPPPPDEARTLFERGVELLQSGSYAEAIDSLRRSIALREAPAAVYNLGLAQRGAGYHSDAIETFGRFLSLATDARYAANRAEVNESIATMRRNMPVIVLRVSGAPDQVTLDGEAIDAVDGMRELRVDPRPHRFEARRRGYEPVTRELDPGTGTRNEVVLEVDAHPLPAHLTIEVTPRTAEIRVNGERVGQGTHELSGDPGRYVVEASADDHGSERRVVTLAPGATERMTLSLAAEDATVFERWWFWTAVGVVVVAAVGGAIYAYNTPGDVDKGSLGVFVEVLRAP